MSKQQRELCRELYDYIQEGILCMSYTHRPTTVQVNSDFQIIGRRLAKFLKAFEDSDSSALRNL